MGTPTLLIYGTKAQEKEEEEEDKLFRTDFHCYVLTWEEIFVGLSKIEHHLRLFPLEFSFVITSLL